MLKLFIEAKSSQNALEDIKTSYLEDLDYSKNIVESYKNVNTTQKEVINQKDLIINELREALRQAITAANNVSFSAN